MIPGRVSFEQANVQDTLLRNTEATCGGRSTGTRMLDVLPGGTVMLSSSRTYSSSSL